MTTRDRGPDRRLSTDRLAARRRVRVARRAGRRDTARGRCAPPWRPATDRRGIVLGEYESDPGRTHVVEGAACPTARRATRRRREQLSAAVGGRAKRRRRVGRGSLARRRRTWTSSTASAPNGSTIWPIRSCSARNAGFALRVLPRTFVMRASAGQNMIAPGRRRVPAAAGRRAVAAGRAHVLPVVGTRHAPRRARASRRSRRCAYHFGDGRSRGRSIHVRRFRQRSADQMATLFGVAGQIGRGQYFVAQVGDGRSRSAGARASAAQFGPHLTRPRRVLASRRRTGSTGHRMRDVRRAAPSVLRDDLERVAGRHRDDRRRSCANGDARRAWSIAPARAFSRDDGARAPVLGQPVRPAGASGAAVSARRAAAGSSCCFRSATCSATSAARRRGTTNC